jgi:predicted Zn-dependent protease
MMKPRYIMSVLCVVFISGGIAIGSPKDARKRISQVERGYTGEDDIKAEIMFGRDVAARILGRYGIYENYPLTKYVNLVGKAVALHAGRPEIEFRFAVLDTGTVNAFAAPGGYIFVTRGALKMMDDEAELASVLAHEVAHVAERHIVKELDIKASDKSQGAALAGLISAPTDTMRAAFEQMVDRAVEMLLETGYKKQDEMDADRISTSLITASGYDPTALKRYLKTIETVKGDDIEILDKTHPSFASRIENLNKFILDNGLLNIKQPVVKERFHDNVHLGQK